MNASCYSATTMARERWEFLFQPSRGVDQFGQPDLRQELHQQMHVVQLALELFSSTSKSVHTDRKISSKRLRCLAVKAFPRHFVTNIERARSR
jgi:hypothetical protein